MKLKPLFLSVLLVLLASCSLESPTSVDTGNSGTSLPFGKEVMVQFSREVPGVGSVPTPVEGSPASGTAMAITGKLMGISDDWIEIQIPTPKPAGAAGPDVARSYWIPKASVLFIRAVELTKAG